MSTVRWNYWHFCVVIRGLQTPKSELGRTYERQRIAEQNEPGLVIRQLVCQPTHVIVHFVIRLLDLHRFLIDLILLEWSGISDDVLLQGWCGETAAATKHVEGLGAPCFMQCYS